MPVVTLSLILIPLPSLPTPKFRLSATAYNGRRQSASVDTLLPVKRDSQPICRIRPRRPPDEVRRPDRLEGIETARRKWEARLRADGMSRSEARRLATAQEVGRRIKESKIGWLLALRREREEAEAARRRDFKPYGLIRTERQPNGWISRWGHGLDCKVRFEEGTDPESFRDQMLQALPDEIETWGKAVGFEVHHSPDHAVRYDRDGKETEG